MKRSKLYSVINLMVFYEILVLWGIKKALWRAERLFTTRLPSAFVEVAKLGGRRYQTFASLSRCCLTGTTDFFPGFFLGWHLTPP